MIDKEILDAVLPLPTLDELKEQKVEELKDEGFVISNFHSGGVFYTMLMIVLRIKVEVIELIRVELNNMIDSHAGGASHDQKKANYSKKRNQADCNHPRGQGTVDVIVTGTAGEATEGLLAAVREAVDKFAGPYDNILVKSSVTVSQNISVTVTTDTADTDEAVENRVKAILTELLAVRRSRKLNELTLSDINHAIRSGYSGATNAAVSEPEADVKLGKDKVITLGDVSVTVERE